jgi:hypothetical protein
MQTLRAKIARKPPKGPPTMRQSALGRIFFRLSASNRMETAMPLTGEAKTKYQREYMRRRRAGKRAAALAAFRKQLAEMHKQLTELMREDRHAAYRASRGD